MQAMQNDGEPLGEGLSLIVDDEESIQEILVDFLEELGYTSIVAASGKEALDLLGKHEFDLVVSDLNMPGMNGVELAKKISELAVSVPFILLSGDVGGESYSNSPGITTLLQKPFRFEELKTCVLELVRPN